MPPHSQSMSWEVSREGDSERPIQWLRDEDLHPSRSAEDDWDSLYFDLGGEG